jgi:hypothetical protein
LVPRPRFALTGIGVSAAEIAAFRGVAWRCLNLIAKTEGALAVTRDQNYEIIKSR